MTGVIKLQNIPRLRLETGADDVEMIGAIKSHACQTCILGRSMERRNKLSRRAVHVDFILLGVLQRAVADSNIKISNLRLRADDGRHGANQGNSHCRSEM